MAFDLLRNRRCAEAVKPEWWNDEALKALSARVVRAAPNDTVANTMRAAVLRPKRDVRRLGGGASLGSGDQEGDHAHLERAAALSHAPASKVALVNLAERCRIFAETM